MENKNNIPINPEMKMPVFTAFCYIMVLVLLSVFLGCLYGAVSQKDYQASLITQCELQYGRECELAAKPRGEW